jgi:hypothetical protein
MATSGSTDFTLNRDQIIAAALRRLRRIDPALTTPAQDVTDCSQALNLLIKEWANDGVLLWLNEEVCLFQQYNTQFYALGPSGDNCCLLSDAKKTQLSADADSGDSSVSVDSDDDIADGDYAGLQLDDGTIQWTTVDGTPSGDSVSFDDPLTDDAAEDNYLFTYTTKIARPTKILEARVRDTDDVDTPLDIITSRSQFLSQTDKDTTGRVLEVHYNPDITNGQLYTWPVCGTGDITDRIVMTVQRVIEDFDASANNFDGPPEALRALIWCLAEEVGPEYGIDVLTGKGAIVSVNAAKYYRRLKRAYRSYEPVQMRP